MRQLVREATGENGQGEERLDLRDLVPDERPADDSATPTPRQIREVKRDKALAQIAVMLLDVAHAIQPVVAVFSGRVFLLIALLSSVWLTMIAMREPTLERGGLVAGFMILSTFLLRWGIK